jgi:bile acid:Na+ symporter, BASS family
MHGSVITTILLPLALGIIMLGLGLSLTVADFRRVIAYPRAIAVGLVCQVLILPAVCFAIAKAFALPPELAVGLMLLSASPGGATANLFSHLAKGDVALNITLTATNSVISLLTLPFIVSASLAHFMSDGREIPIQPDKVIQVFAIVLVPVAIGMLVRAKKTETALRLERPVRILSAVFLVLIIVAALAKDRANLGTAFAQVGFPALVFNLASLGVGYFVPRLLRLPKRQAIAIGMEIGIHNGTLAIAIATTVLARDAMAVPPAIYSIIMFFTAAAFGVLVQRGEPVKEIAPDLAA